MMLVTEKDDRDCWLCVVGDGGERELLLTTNAVWAGVESCAGTGGDPLKMHSFLIIESVILILILTKFLRSYFV